MPIGVGNGVVLSVLPNPSRVNSNGEIGFVRIGKTMQEAFRVICGETEYPR